MNTAKLTEFIKAESRDPSQREIFFDAAERDVVDRYAWSRECPDHTFPPSCDVNLFFGLFFDGTNNNLKRDMPKNTHSNVARLYTAFPGLADKHGSEAWPEFVEKYHKSFFRTYVPGVGTPFDDVGDSGEGFNVVSSDRAKGLAFAYLAENRILWAMVQTINNVHIYYLNKPLLDTNEFKRTVNKFNVPSNLRASEELTQAFTDLLKRLQKALTVYLPVGPGKDKSKGIVKNIFVSMFGFSRGAAEVRAFLNWFIWLCKLDSVITQGQGLTLGSIPVTIDFLGIFDTVASVGIAATAKIADGHQAWADAEHTLRFPLDSGPGKCLHIVSAHEIRRSFPLDSILYRGVLPESCTEIVFPGVHSNVGGGYAPKEQGRGTDSKGSDMLSRISLAMMYKAARLAGAPLKLEDASEKVKESFHVDSGMIATFNEYLKAGGVEKDKPPPLAPLHEIMEQQHKLYILWREKMVGKIKDLPNVKNMDSPNPRFDKTDLEEADKEFAEEVKNFNEWRNDLDYDEDERHQRYHFSNPEWTAINKYWDSPPPLKSITDLFEKYVHDSRAWFKPFGNDVPDLLHALELLSFAEETRAEWEANPKYDRNIPRKLSTEERRKVLQYRKVKGTPAELDLLTPDKTGREPTNPGFLKSWIIVPGGYLRYRRIYMGSDSFKPAGAQYAGLAPMNVGGQRNMLASNGDSDKVQTEEAEESLS